MKNIFLIISLILTNTFLLPQELLDGPQWELYLNRDGFPSFPPLFNVTNNIEALSVKYCRAANSNEIAYLCTECNSPSSVTINNYLIISSGWNICNDDAGSFPYFGYTFYKMTNNFTNDFFFWILEIVIINQVIYMDIWIQILWSF